MAGRALGGESFLIKAVVAAGVTTRDRYMPDFIQKLAKELPMIRPLMVFCNGGGASYWDTWRRHLGSYGNQIWRQKTRGREKTAKSAVVATPKRGNSNSGMESMTDRKAQLVTLRAFLMLAVITVAIATFTAIVSVWPGP
ncbi:MAG: hypothetical protein WBL84_19760 [Xanthobacteraceae bacterium]|jgi:hypothetical protein